MRLMTGEDVLADERFFLVRTQAFTPSRQGWSATEVDAMADHRWWSLDALEHRQVQVWPEDIAVLLRGAGD